MIYVYLLGYTSWDILTRCYQNWKETHLILSNIHVKVMQAREHNSNWQLDKMPHGAYNMWMQTRNLKEPVQYKEDTISVFSLMIFLCIISCLFRYIDFDYDISFSPMSTVCWNLLGKNLSRYIFLTKYRIRSWGIMTSAMGLTYT